MTSEEISKLIELKGDEIMSKIILEAIEDHKPVADKMKRLYDRYKGEVPIKTRENIDKSGLSLNNKIATDYEGIIIDEIKGYIWGKPILVTYEDGDTSKDLVKKKIKEFKTLNNMDSLDEESGEYSCACGYGSRLLYIDTEGIIRVMNTKPWQTYFIYNNSTDEIDFAMIYYEWQIVDVVSGKVIKTTKVEWYDNENVSYWIKQGGRFVREDLTAEQPDYQNPQPHGFSYVPVIQIKTNNLIQSDIEKVESLIDAYNELISDAQNEAQEFVHAYLKSIGAAITPEERIAARRTRVFNLPDNEADVDFITKNVNPEFFENQKKTLNDNIYRSAKVVDMNDEKFSSGGAESGEARKWKLLALEFKAITKERKFTEALRQMYKVVGSAWKKLGVNFDYLKLNFSYSRSLPIDFLYYARVANELRGTLPLIDILSKLPFVDDPPAVYKRLQQEEDFQADQIFEGKIKKLLQQEE